MDDDKLKVYINKTYSGNLAYENEKYIFNYLDGISEIVSLTMPVRVASWNSQKLHPIFEMNLPEGALKEAIKNHFSKISMMDDISLLRLIGPYMLGRVKFEKIVDEKEKIELDDILNSKKQNLFNELMDRSKHDPQKKNIMATMKSAQGL